MSRYSLYINLIRELIERIEKSTKGISQKEFIENIDLIDSTLMRLQAIGESVKNIPPEAKKEIKDINWKKFENLRNFISHKYADVDYNIIWNIIQMNIPKLKAAIAKIK